MIYINIDLITYDTDVIYYLKNLVLKVNIDTVLGAVVNLKYLSLVKQFKTITKYS